MITHEIHRHINNSLGQKCQDLAIRLVERKTGYRVINAIGGRLCGTLLKPIARIIDVSKHIFHTSTHLIFGALATIKHQTIGRCFKLSPQSYFVTHSITHLGLVHLFLMEIIPSPGNLLDPRIYKIDHTKQKTKITSLKKQLESKPTYTPPPIIAKTPSPAKETPPSPLPRIPTAPKVNQTPIPKITRSLTSSSPLSKKISKLSSQFRKNWESLSTPQKGCQITPELATALGHCNLELSDLHQYEEHKDLWISELSRNYEPPKDPLKIYICKTRIQQALENPISSGEYINEIEAAIAELKEYNPFVETTKKRISTQINTTALLEVAAQIDPSKRVALLAEQFGRLLRTLVHIKQNSIKRKTGLRPQPRVHRQHQAASSSSQKIKTSPKASNNTEALKEFFYKKQELISESVVRASRLRQELEKHFPPILQQGQNVELLKRRDLLGCLLTMNEKFPEFFSDDKMIMEEIEKEYYPGTSQTTRRTPPGKLLLIKKADSPDWDENAEGNTFSKKRIDKKKLRSIGKTLANVLKTR